MADKRGGKRSGAGRPPGSATKRTREAANRAAESGQTPLDYLLEVMRDAGNDQSVRIDAAKSAAPYVHPRLSSVDANVDHGGSVTFKVVTGIERS